MCLPTGHNGIFLWDGRKHSLGGQPNFSKSSLANPYNVYAGSETGELDVLCSLPVAQSP